jgi:hypothetical protein
VRRSALRADAGALTPALRAAFGVWLGLALACSRVATPDVTLGPPHGTIFAFADLRGTLKPCGCSPDLRRGGLDRIAEVLRNARTSAPDSLILLAGDLLLDEEGLPDALRAQTERKISSIAESLTAMGVAAVSLGPSDLAQPEWLATALPRLKTPVVVTNPPANAAWAVFTVPSMMLRAGGVSVGVIGLVPGDTVAEVTRTESAALRAKGARVIVALSGLGLRASKKLARSGVGVDVVLAAGQGFDAVVTDEVEPLGPPEAPTYLLQSFVQGGQIGRLDLDLKGPGLVWLEPGNTAPVEQGTLRWSLTPVNWDLPRDPTVAAIMDAFDKDLEEINQGAAGDPIPAEPGVASYVGVEKCLTCHADTKPFWEGDQHQLAWETLERDKKTFDNYCVSCHVTGFRRPGGSALKKLEGLVDVQCESCHGPGSLHAAAGDTASIVRDPPESTCKTCHSAKHSTHFDFDTYRPKLLVPGHGRPL